MPHKRPVNLSNRPWGLQGGIHGAPTLRMADGVGGPQNCLCILMEYANDGDLVHLVVGADDVG